MPPDGDKITKKAPPPASPAPPAVSAPPAKAKQPAAATTKAAPQKLEVVDGTEGKRPTAPTGTKTPKSSAENTLSPDMKVRLQEIAKGLCELPSSRRSVKERDIRFLDDKMRELLGLGGGQRYDGSKPFDQLLDDIFKKVYQPRPPPTQTDRPTTEGRPETPAPQKPVAQTPADKVQAQRFEKITNAIDALSAKLTQIMNLSPPIPAGLLKEVASLSHDVATLTTTYAQAALYMAAMSPAAMLPAAHLAEIYLGFKEMPADVQEAIRQLVSPQVATKTETALARLVTTLVDQLQKNPELAAKLGDLKMLLAQLKQREGGGEQAPKAHPEAAEKGATHADQQASLLKNRGDPKNLEPKGTKADQSTAADTQKAPQLRAENMYWGNLIPKEKGVSSAALKTEEEEEKEEQPSEQQQEEPQEEEAEEQQVAQWSEEDALELLSRPESAPTPLASVSIHSHIHNRSA